MNSSLDDFRVKLVNKVLMAGNETDTARFCETALRSLEQHRINGHLVLRFAEKIVYDMDSFNPKSKNQRQWSNIVTARSFFHRVSEKMRGGAEK